VSKNVFWGNNPNVLFTNFELFPTPEGTFNQNLNAVTRFIIILSIVMAIVTGRLSVFLIGILTMFFIYLYYYIFHRNRNENFENPNSEYEKLERLKAIQKMLFDKPSSVNPFGNVLNSDIEGNPKKLPAPSVEDPDVQDAIFESAKNAMILNNPTFPDIDKKLLKNLGDVYQFEQSLQPFYTNPATTIPNDQTSFADFCYGSMISCKEGNLFACGRNSESSHHNKY
jgi:Ca2+/Na+ antiporter